MGAATSARLPPYVRRTLPRCRRNEWCNEIGASSLLFSGVLRASMQLKRQCSGIDARVGPPSGCAARLLGADESKKEQGCGNGSWRRSGGEVTAAVWGNEIASEILNIFFNGHRGWGEYPHLIVFKRCYRPQIKSLIFRENETKPTLLS